MDIVTGPIEEYLHRITPASHEVLQEMEARAERDNFPIIGRLAGRLLAQLAAMIEAKSVLELGSGYGYSAAWFASAMQDGGTVICTDFSEKNKKDAEQYLTRLGLWSRIDFRVGNAMDVLREEQGPFDIVYFDIKKQFYVEALELAKPKVRPGGLIIADNVLLHGTVVETNPSESTRGVLRFNERIYSDPELESTILPLRDGIAICRKRV